MLPVLVAAHGVSPAAAVEGGEAIFRTFQKQKIKHKNKIAGQSKKEAQHKPDQIGGHRARDRHHTTPPLQRLKRHADLCENADREDDHT